MSCFHASRRLPEANLARTSNKTQSTRHLVLQLSSQPNSPKLGSISAIWDNLGPHKLTLKLTKVRSARSNPSIELVHNQGGSRGNTARNRPTEQLVSRCRTLTLAATTSRAGGVGALIDPLQAPASELEMLGWHEIPGGPNQQRMGAATQEWLLPMEDFFSASAPRREAEAGCAPQQRWQAAAHQARPLAAQWVRCIAWSWAESPTPQKTNHGIGKARQMLTRVLGSSMDPSSAKSAPS